MPSPFIKELEAARTSQVGFVELEKGGPAGTTVAEIVSAIVRTDQQPWRADFRSGSLNTTEDWTVIQTGAGQTIDASTGNLVLSAGVSTNSETIIRSKRRFTLPLRAAAALTLSQRIANQEFYVELVNAAGDSFARWKFDGTSTTANKIETASGALAANKSLDIAATSSATSASTVWEIDLAIDEANFRNRSANSSSAATTRTTRMSNLPHPDDELYLQLRVKNLGSAPTSTTAFTLEYLFVQDVNELAVEVVGGRGADTANSGIAVAPSALVTSAARIGQVAAAGQWFDSTTAALAASATFTGATRDLWSVVSGGANTSSNSYPKEYRVIAISDVVGTLNIEVSRDSGVTWRRISAITASNTNTGGLYVAQTSVIPVMRHARAIYTNGAGAQTHFTLSEALMGI